jgi:Na+/H+-dicarboxylate symporter
MAFTIGTYGVAALAPLARLMGSFYLTCGLFVVVVLGSIALLVGFNIFRCIFYIKDKLLTVLVTSSSESALVPLMRKLEKLGCSKSVVGLVVPSGYSFNLDGTNLYLTMAALFVAQALNIELTLTQQLTMLGVAMLTSKGASGVTGAGFIPLAATLAVVPTIPVADLALILGIDRFMSEARALTNFIGNGMIPQQPPHGHVQHPPPPGPAGQPDRHTRLGAVGGQPAEDPERFYPAHRPVAVQGVGAR